MKKKSKNLETSILATNLKKQEQDMEIWKKKREAKINLYRAFSEYIYCLEDSLEHETDLYKRYLTQQEIKKLKKEQKKFYDIPILSMDLENKEQKEEDKMKKWHSYQHYIMQLESQLLITINKEKRAEIERKIKKARKMQKQLLMSDSIIQDETKENKNYGKIKNISYNSRNEEQYE